MKIEKLCCGWMREQVCRQELTILKKQVQNEENCHHPERVVGSVLGNLVLFFCPWCGEKVRHDQLIPEIEKWQQQLEREIAELAESNRFTYFGDGINFPRDDK